jgi:dTDP-4-amino-4,6-dideoxygalactose transaminase
MNKRTELRSGQNALNVPLTRPYFDEEEIEEIKEVLDSGWVSQGPKTKKFEDAFAKYVGAKYVIAVTNCTAALHLSLLGMKFWLPILHIQQLDILCYIVVLNLYLLMLIPKHII